MPNRCWPTWANPSIPGLCDSVSQIVPDIEGLLDLMLADLTRPEVDPGTPQLNWALLESQSGCRSALVNRFIQRHGAPRLVLSCQQKSSPIEGAGPRVVIVEWGGNSADILPSTSNNFAQLVVQVLPPCPWGLLGLRGFLKRRNLRHQGFACLAIGSTAILLRHRRWGRERSAIPSIKQVLKIQSFDFWDTLITRWDSDPKRVFDYVGELAGIPNFRQQRVTAERQARQRQDNYKLAHIYEVLTQASGLQPERCQELMELELEAERQFAQPVRANLDRLGAGDLVISDMYLSADQMRRIARPHINLDRHPFLVSSSGKQQGRVWRKLRQAGIEARHRGDNVVADVVKAAQRDHQVAQVRSTGFSSLERQFEDAGLTGLANLMRLQRLDRPGRGPDPEPSSGGIDGLLQVQRRLNLPLLYLLSLELMHRGCRADGPSQLLFCARDCAYLHGLYRSMVEAQQRFAPDWCQQSGTGLPPHAYYLTSRQAKARASKGYRAYSRSLLEPATPTRQPLLIDVQGSGRSSHHFFSTVLKVPVRQLFIYASGNQAASCGAESLLNKDFLRKILPRASDLLEVLNYSSDHSLVDMHSLEGLGFVPEFEAEQRPLHLLKICREFEGFFGDVNARMAQGPFQYLFARHDLLAYRPEHLQLLEEVDGLEDLRLLRDLFLRFHRRH